MYAIATLQQGALVAELHHMRSNMVHRVIAAFMLEHNALGATQYPANEEGFNKLRKECEINEGLQMFVVQLS